jgi:RNA polymerase sigma factor (sigma-70 family)
MTRTPLGPDVAGSILRGSLEETSGSRRGAAAKYPAPVTDALWQRYRTTDDPGARAQLLQRYLGLVHHVARAIAARTPLVEIGDLVSAGTLGLVRALESFDLSRGLAFSTYAVSRIRGAILDDLRSRDWTPRSVRVKGRRLATAIATLERKLERAPEPREVAAALGIDLATYWGWRTAVDGGVMVSFDTVAANGQRHPLTLEETLNDPNAPLPGDALTSSSRSRSFARRSADCRKRSARCSRCTTTRSSTCGRSPRSYT